MLGTMSEPPGYPPYEPGSDLPVSRPPRPASPGHRLGRADGVSTRVEGRGSEAASQTVLAFRLVDPQTAMPSEVEIRGRTIAGTVRDGDWVEVAGEPGPSGRLEPLRVTNLSTRSEVSSVGSSRSPVARVLAVLFVLFFLTVLGAILYGFYDMFVLEGL